MNNNYNIIRIQQYLNGELSSDEMYRLEREALDDPLLQDAIDGYRMQKEVSHRQLSLLQQRLAARIAQQAKERSTFYFSWQRLAIAATACVLMVLVLVLLWMRNQSLQPKTTEKEVEVALAPVAGGAVHVRAEAVNEAGFDAQPEGGWEQLNAHLAENAGRITVSGEVILMFEIDAEGKPTAIQHVGKADPLLLNEIRQVLTEGPIWKGSKGKLVLTRE
ncbi:hypothetical protein JHJ32_05000 [Parapedobacter sp. ISTM3]|nr:MULTISPECIES: hypothetical protein [Parapedobacter]MBK1439337.1 hypothetical protein [Parapedobacter sp. ISTM3]